MIQSMLQNKRLVGNGAENQLSEAEKLSIPSAPAIERPQSLVTRFPRVHLKNDTVRV